MKNPVDLRRRSFRMQTTAMRIVLAAYAGKPGFCNSGLSFPVVTY